MCWPREVQSSIRVAKESWGLLSSDCRANRPDFNPEYSLQGLKLKPQYFGHLMCTDDSLEKSLILEKTEGRRGRGCQRVRWLDSIMDTVNVNLGSLWEMVRDREAWCAEDQGATKSQTKLGNSTTATIAHRKNM